MKRTLCSELDNLFESISSDLQGRHLNEKDKQDETEKEINLDLKKDLGDDSQNDDVGGDGDQDQGDDHMSSVGKEIENMNHVPELDEIVEKLNTIRAGRSLKDADVHSQFQEYYDDLNKPEKIALYAYLKGLGEIVTGGLPGDEATDPGDKNVPVDIKHDSKKGVRSIKPNIVKEPIPPEKKKTSNKEEDTTPPAPIKPVNKT